jgi:hypothetical protein
MEDELKSGPNFPPCPHCKGETKFETSMANGISQPRIGIYRCKGCSKHSFFSNHEGTWVQWP